MCFFFHLLIVFCSKISLTVNLTYFALNIYIDYKKMNICVILSLIKEPNIYLGLLGPVSFLLTLFLVILQGVLFSFVNEIFPISIFIWLLLRLRKLIDNFIYLSSCLSNFILVFFLKMIWFYFPPSPQCG